MDRILLYPIGISDSCRYASAYLKQAGFSLIDHPSPEVTHLLLDTPSYDPMRLLPDGSNTELILRMLPETTTLIGGKLEHPLFSCYRTIDLLKDSRYLASNAGITAECALQAASAHMQRTFADTPVLILGWGRIGKCLSKLLKAMGCQVTVAARKESDRAILEALGYRTVDFSGISQALSDCKLLFNTVPDLPLHRDVLEQWKNGISIDLASYPGLDGKNVIPARGLPGKYAPESSGKLIAETIIRIHREGNL